MGSKKPSGHLRGFRSSQGNGRRVSCGAKVVEQIVGTALLPPDPILFPGNARNGGHLLDGADLAAYYDRTRPR